MRISVVGGDLPAQFEQLRQEARAEGFDHIETLWSQWQDGVIRFTRPGKQLLMAEIDGGLAGVGGITADFMDPAAMRMRRFYVRPAFRRLGVARAIASRVIQTALPLDRPIVLYTETDAGAAFWESMGFVRIARENTTHHLVETSSAPPRGSTGSP